MCQFQQDGFEFLVRFDLDDVPDLLVDEPEPLGHGRGPRREPARAGGGAPPRSGLRRPPPRRRHRRARRCRDRRGSPGAPRSAGRRARRRPRPGRARRSSAGCSILLTTSSTARSSHPRVSSGAMATTRISLSPPTRARQPSRTSRTRFRRVTISGSTTRLRPAAPPATTTRKWALPQKARGYRCSAFFVK